MVRLFVKVGIPLLEVPQAHWEDSTTPFFDGFLQHDCSLSMCVFLFLSVRVSACRDAKWCLSGRSLCQDDLGTAGDL